MAPALPLQHLHTLTLAVAYIEYLRGQQAPSVHHICSRSHRHVAGLSGTSLCPSRPLMALLIEEHDAHLAATSEPTPLSSLRPVEQAGSYTDGHQSSTLYLRGSSQGDCPNFILPMWIWKAHESESLSRFICLTTSKRKVNRWNAPQWT